MTPQDRLNILMAAVEMLRESPYVSEFYSCGQCLRTSTRRFFYEGKRYQASFWKNAQTGELYTTIDHPREDRGTDFIGTLSIGSDGRALYIIRLLVHTTASPIPKENP